MFGGAVGLQGSLRRGARAFIGAVRRLFSRPRRSSDRGFLDDAPVTSAGVAVVCILLAALSFDFLKGAFNAMTSGIERVGGTVPSVLLIAADLSEWLEDYVFYLMPFGTLLAVTDGLLLARKSGGFARGFAASARTWVVLLSAWLPLLALYVGIVVIRTETILWAPLSVQIWFVSMLPAVLYFRTASFRRIAPESKVYATSVAVAGAPIAAAITFLVLFALGSLLFGSQQKGRVSRPTSTSALPQQDERGGIVPSNAEAPVRTGGADEAPAR